MEEPRLTIGAFARAVGLTPSALRFYDECGLLKPAQVDGATGYRYYTPEFARRAQAVARVAYPAHRMILDGLAEAPTRVAVSSEELLAAIDSLGEAETDVRITRDGLRVGPSNVAAVVQGPEVTVRLGLRLATRAVGSLLGPPS